MLGKILLVIGVLWVVVGLALWYFSLVWGGYNPPPQASMEWTGLMDRTVDYMAIAWLLLPLIGIVLGVVALAVKGFNSI